MSIYVVMTFYWNFGNAQIRVHFVCVHVCIERNFQKQAIDFSNVKNVNWKIVHGIFHLLNVGRYAMLSIYYYVY